MDENTSASSPLIDLTSRSPSPSPSSLPSAPAAPPKSAQQLSSYATCGQTRVVTTVSPIHATPTPKLVELNSSLVSGNSVEPALTHPSSSALPATTLTSSIASVTSVAPSLTHLQSHQSKKLNASRGVDKPLPALVEYGGTTLGSSSASGHSTDPLHVKGEPLPLQYSTQLPPTSDEGSLIHTTDTSGMHNPSVILPTTAESSPSEPAQTSGNPSQVGVVTPQVGVVLSQSPDSEFPPLRLKCSIGDELDLEVDREEQEDEEDKEAEEMNRECIEEEEEEEDVDSVMELRIEEAGADTSTEAEHGHLNPSKHGKQTATSNTPENIEGEGDEDSTESSSNQNSVGTSPPTSVGVRVHGHMEAADATRLVGEEPQSLEGSPRPSHNRVMRPMVPSAPHNRDVLPSYRVRKVTKVKQFFTTLQHFGNRQSSEVAEQVQELIAALVVGWLA